jgi:hypothetical protein
MPTRRRKPPPKPDRQSILELIAGCGPLGMPEAILQAHGWTLADMVELVLVEDRLKVTRVRLADAGRRALEKGRQ